MTFPIINFFPQVSNLRQRLEQSDTRHEDLAESVGLETERLNIYKMGLDTERLKIYKMGMEIWKDWLFTKWVWKYGEFEDLQNVTRWGWPPSPCCAK